MTLMSAALYLSMAPVSARAHCDGLDGPVVMAARKALETGNVNLVLIWVQKASEPEIRTAFEVGSDHAKPLIHLQMTCFSG